MGKAHGEAGEDAVNYIVEIVGGELDGETREVESLPPTFQIAKVPSLGVLNEITEPAIIIPEIIKLKLFKTVRTEEFGKQDVMKGYYRE